MSLDVTYNYHYSSYVIKVDIEFDCLFDFVAFFKARFKGTVTNVFVYFLQLFLAFTC